MEGFLVSAATGVLKAVTVKLATLLGEKYKNLKDVRKEIKPLADELNRIHAFLQDMSENENPVEQDKLWMADVREMSYDIEDSLDDFFICSDGDRSAKPKGLIKKCKKLLKKMKAHQQISKAIQDFKIQIKVVAERNERYRTGAMSTWQANEVVSSRALVIFKEVSELVGMDKPKEELISLLMNDRSTISSQDQLKVVSIVGFGGLGKTTLASQVQEALKDKFDCLAFVTVSRNPDMMEVLSTILSDITGEKDTGTAAKDVPHLIKKISNFLQDKRYFIVVDDLWDSGSWETIKYAFIKNTCGSRVITTTRISEVGESCRSSYGGHIYKIRPLDAVNSRRLFLRRVFGSEEGCPSHLIEVSDGILKKCDGLPLAIIAIAGLLASKAPTFLEWNKVQSSFGYALERQSDVNRMMQILSLSYFDLRPHLRSCLLYLSIFPEDHKINKERLVLRWIAEGFIQEEHGFTQYELGQRCFNELINRSLIQEGRTTPLGILMSCQVHDTILEFIVSKAVEENFVTLFGVPNVTADSQRKIRRLSLQDRNGLGDGLVGLREDMVYSDARSVSVFPGSLDSLPSLLNFRRVRVLDLDDYEGLRAHHLAHLGGLPALRYLRLRGREIQELPEKIGELQYLQTLDVRGTGIVKLPSSVVRLSRLVNLLGSSLRLPDGFRNMQALQRLECISLSSQSPNFLQELCQLGNVRSLGLDWVNFTKELVSSLCILAKGNLDSLIMLPNGASLDFVMEPWSPTPVSLKILEIWTVYLPRVPTWMGSLDNLQNLHLGIEQLGPGDIALVGRLNALRCLSLIVLIEVADRSSSSPETQRVKITGAHGFPSLEEFIVGDFPCRLGLLFEAGSMPKLRELTLEFNPDKTASVTNGEFDFGIQHLPCLATVRCVLGWGYIRPDDAEPEHPAWDAVKRAVSSNPNHPRLYYDRF